MNILKSNKIVHDHDILNVKVDLVCLGGGGVIIGEIFHVSEH